jgi:hypothetical protein
MSSLPTYVRSATTVSFSSFLPIWSSLVSRTRVDDLFVNIINVTPTLSTHIWLLHLVDCIKATDLYKVSHHRQFFIFPAYLVKFGKQDESW